MKTLIPISMKGLAERQMENVRAGRLSREQAEAAIKKQLRHSSKTREDLIEGLARDYDPAAVEVLEYFRLI